MEIGPFLSLAVAISSSLAQLHTLQAAYERISPGNILLNRTNGAISFISSSELASQPFILQYISPEQTGRMNRASDYRTDLYSLGTVFYEMLTGHPPFPGPDPSEIIHAHIARQAEDPACLIPGLPAILSDIVMKLLAKAAEDRYQTATGLQADLEKCHVQWDTEGHINDFELGQLDISEQLLIPQKLYGRDEDIAALMSSYHNMVISSRPEMVFVTGYSGIGKSALIRELYKPASNENAIFVSGKFEQYRSAVPYASITGAFRDLLRQILTGTEDEISGWRIAFLKALGVNAQLMSDMIPYLELIIGQQALVPNMPPAESQNRFHMVFKQFIGVFAKKEHPLIVFLDDAQWIDPPSLGLLEYLATQNDISHLMLIGSYRDNEVGPNHPLALTLNAWQKSRLPLKILTLKPLSLQHVLDMTGDTFRTSSSSIHELAELLFDKTAGNPFFIIQFLKILHEEGFISFDKQQMEWVWKASQIEAHNYTDNVVELMLAKLRKLPEMTQNILRHAACIGSRFDLKTLAIICNLSIDNAYLALEAGLNEGLLLSVESGQYQFLHDRVHQAAYALIPEEKLADVHLQIGRILLLNANEADMDEQLFHIVYQLNLGSSRIDADAEKHELARLNHRAGTKAISSLAYEPACHFFDAGMALLDDNAWERQYALVLALHEDGAQAACLTGSFARCEQLVHIVLERATAPIHKVKAYETRLEMFIAQGNLSRTVTAGLDMLRVLGLEMPDKPVVADFTSGLDHLRAQRLGEFSSEKIAGLVDLPLMSDPDSLAKMRILNALISPTFLSAPELMPLIALNMVDLSIQYGNCYASPFGYCSLGFILCAVVGDIESGYQFGKMAVELLNHIDATKTRARTIYLFNAFVRHLHEHLRDTIAGIEEAYLICMQTGDFEYAARSLTLVPRYQYWMGEELTKVEERMKPSRRIVEQIKQQTSIAYIQIFQQAVSNFIRRTENHSLLTGEYCDEQALMVLLDQTGNRHGIFLAAFNKLLLSYIFHDYSSAIENAVLGAANVNSSRGLYHFFEFFCYDSLAHLAVYAGSEPARQAEILARVQENQEKVGLWAKFAPMNHLHRWHLVEAETARVLGQDEKAVYHFTLAADKAAESGYIYEEALAWELGAGHHFEQGRKSYARMCLKEALSRYQKWGSNAKVQWLEERHPFLSSTHSLAAAGQSPIEQLDTRSVVRASQAVSSEILLPRLVEILMQIVLENAGAQKGVLLINTANVLSIYATAEYDGDAISVSTPVDPAISSAVLPVGIINYVSRSREKMIFEDAVLHPMLTGDEYVQSQQPHSVLCMPVVRQNNLMAVLYLENNLVSGAFTENILDVLELIASQAAISIENAILYSDLQASENRFRAIFEQTFQLIGLMTPNGTLIAANDSSLEMLGIEDANAVIGQPFWETPWWSHSLELQEQLKDAISRAAEGELVRFEATHPAFDGILHHIDFSIKPVKDENDQTILLIPEGRDITERKQFEEALLASEEKYRAIFENTGTATIIIEEDTTITLVNSEFARLFGYSREEIEGKMSWTDFTRGAQREMMLDYHYGRRADRSDIPSNYEFEFVDRYGSIRNTLISVSLIPGTRQSVAVIVDVTEQRHAEAEKIRLQKLLRNIIDSMPSVIITVDGQSRVKQWNAGAERMIGLMAKDVIDQPLFELHPLAAVFRDQLALALSKGQVQKVEKVQYIRDERKSYAEITIYPLVDVDIQGAVVRIDDVTEKVRLDETIIQTEKMMSVGGLAAGMAHEINNPLGGIIQGVQNIERRLDPDLMANKTAASEIGLNMELLIEYASKREIGRLLEGIKQSGIRASVIVRNMLQFSRQRLAEHSLSRTEEMLERSLDLASSDYDLKKKYDFRHIDIVRHYDPGVGEIECAESEIEQVILNLLKNAAQAMHEQENPAIKPQLILRTYQEGDMAVMEIEDNGPGMDENITRRIFEPFFTTKPAGEGTGLGLSVSYFIITQNHRGKMLVESSPGRGAIFTIKLPLADAPQYPHGL